MLVLPVLVSLLIFLDGAGLIDRRWGHLDDGVCGDRATWSCRGYCFVPGHLQTVPRAELCVIFALQAADAVHLGVDNLGVVRHVGRLLNGKKRFQSD